MIMALSFSFLLSSAVIALISFSPGTQSKQTYYPPNASCFDYFIPLNITSAQYSFNATKWTDNDGLTQFVIENVGRDPGKVSPLSMPSNVTAQYSISATFCTPKDSSSNKAKTVLLATHGLGFDRS